MLPSVFTRLYTFDEVGPGGGAALAKPTVPVLFNDITFPASPPVSALYGVSVKGVTSPPPPPPPPLATTSTLKSAVALPPALSAVTVTVYDPGVAPEVAVT